MHTPLRSSLATYVKVYSSSKLHSDIRHCGHSWVNSNSKSSRGFQPDLITLVGLQRLKCFSQQFLISGCVV